VNDLPALAGAVRSSATDLAGPLLTSIVSDTIEEISARALDNLRAARGGSTSFAGDYLRAEVSGRGPTGTVNLTPARTWILVAGARPHRIAGRAGRIRLAAAKGGTIFRSGPVAHPGFRGTNVVGQTVDDIEPAITDAVADNLEGITNGW
jgi:hypothetical protein